MKQSSTPFNLRQRAAKALCPNEETLIAIRLFARAFNPHHMLLSEN